MQKGRCNFPDELRRKACDTSAYVFYSSRHKRAFAVLDPAVLQSLFTSDFDQIPVEEKSIDKQGKIYLGSKKIEKYGIEEGEKDLLYFLEELLKMMHL